ncbi:MAG: carboxypeptidase regulatory-like domain-containing protein [Vicinamibacterales bacterium]
MKALIPTVLLVSLLFLRGVEVQTQAQLGSWGPVLDWGYQAKHMAALPNGKVLVFRTGDTARVWDPATNGFLMAPSFFGDLHCAAQLMLSDGRIIVVGGQMNSTHIGIKVTSIFDYRTNTWTKGTDMKYARWYPTAAMLGNGEVLVTTGDDDHGNRVGIPEVYNPVTDTWRQLTSANRTQQLYAFMYQLPNGKVYEAAPDTATFYLDVNGTGSWANGPTSQWSTSAYSESGAMYGPGKILRTGGGDPATARTAVIDMTVANPQWRETTPMQYARRRMNLVILADGSLLAVGGTRSSDNESSAVLQAEIWNPVTEQWSTVAAMSEARMYHSTALLLPDGRVISGGGEASGRNHAQVYSPPYLFKGARPVISAAPDAVSFGASFAVTTPSPGTITSVALLRPGAPTHALDFNQRYLPLAFTTTANGLTVTAPLNGNHAPPGYYMLIIKDSNGVPSVASWVRIDVNANPAPGTLGGTVTDAASSLGVAGATVQLGGQSTTTDPDGAYTFSSVTAGPHTVSVNAAGYAAASKNVTVLAGQTATLNFALVPPGTVSGQVVDALGAPIAAATITYEGGSTSTSPTGEFVVNNIASGTQSITASATQFVPGTLVVVVPPNGSVVGNFTLTVLPSYIGGEVVNVATSQPIQGATVSYYGGSVTTDALGRYHLPDVSPGTVSVTVAAAGFVGATQIVEVPYANYATSDFDLTPLVLPPPPPSPTRIKDITFEGGLTDASTGFDKTTTGVALLTSSALRGTRSGTATSGYFEESFTGVDDFYVSFYLRVNALTSGSPRILLIQNSGTTVGNLLLTTTGLRLRTASSTIGADSGALTPGQIYRIGLHQKKGTGKNAVLEAYLAQGDNAFTTPFASTSTGTWKTPAGRLRLGATSGTVNLTIDDVRLDSNVMPGSATSPVTPLTADFTADVTSGTAPLTVNFNSGTSTGAVTGWSWDLQNDGTPDSALANPTVVYNAAGTYSVQLTVSDSTTTASRTRTAYINVSAPTPTDPPPVTGTLTAALVADAQVSKTSPTKNDGALTTLRTREGDASNLATYHSYLKFDVTGLSASVVSAKLRLYATDANTAGILVHSADSGWVETTINWNSRPLLGSQVGSAGAIAANTWVEISLPPSLFTTNQSYTLVVVGRNTQSEYFSSREGLASQRPQLVLSVGP